MTRSLRDSGAQQIVLSAFILNPEDRRRLAEGVAPGSYIAFVRLGPTPLNFGRANR